MATHRLDWDPVLLDAVAQLRDRLERVTRERDQAVQCAVMLQVRGGRANRALEVEEAIATALEWIGEPIPIGDRIAEALAEHDRATGRDPTLGG